MPVPAVFTGERFLPECTGEIWAEHWHRYGFVASWVRGLEVLDAASGEGYGAALLARQARSVVGVDVDVATVAAARGRYAQPNLRFETASVTTLPFGAGQFDCIVSFETLEHLEAQEAMLSEFRRVLRPGGFLVVSTPNKIEYTDRRGFHNEYHVRELYEAEFRALVAREFPAQRWYGQKLLMNSGLWPYPERDAASAAQWLQLGQAGTALPVPMYFIAVAARDEASLPADQPVSLLADPTGTMYAEYEQTVRRAATLETLLAERERIVVERDGQLAAVAGRIAHAEALVAERDRRVAPALARAERAEELVVERDRQLARVNARAATLEELLAERERIIVERDADLRRLDERAAAIERVVAERDRQLEQVNGRAATLEGLLATREALVVERDAQLAQVVARVHEAEGVIAAREALIVERDAQLAQVNERIRVAEGLIAVREALIVERDGQLAAVNARAAQLEAHVQARDTRIAAQDAESSRQQAHITGLEQSANTLAAEVERRGSLLWLVVLPFHRLRALFARRADPGRGPD